MEPVGNHRLEPGIRADHGGAAARIRITTRPGAMFVSRVVKVALRRYFAEPARSVIQPRERDRVQPFAQNGFQRILPARFNAYSLPQPRRPGQPALLQPLFRPGAALEALLKLRERVRACFQSRQPVRGSFQRNGSLTQRLISVGQFSLLCFELAAHGSQRALQRGDVLAQAREPGRSRRLQCSASSRKRSARCASWSSSCCACARLVCSICRAWSVCASARCNSS